VKSPMLEFHLQHLQVGPGTTSGKAAAVRSGCDEEAEAADGVAAGAADVVGAAGEPDEDAPGCFLGRAKAGQELEM
jgi:hypothetical protein